MAESLYSGLEKVVECAICLNLFDTPKLLPCGHSFCAACVDGLVTAGGQLACPECRQTSVVPPGGLPTNLIAAAAIRELTAWQEAAKKNLCNHCERRLAADEAYTCGDCDGTLICAHCAFAAHNGHRLLELPSAVQVNQAKVDEWKNQMESGERMLTEKHDWLQLGQAEFARVIDRLTAILQAVRADSNRGAELAVSCGTLLAAIERISGSEESYVAQQGDLKMLTAAAVRLQNDLSQAATDINQFVADRAVLSSLVIELSHVLGRSEHVFQPTDLELEIAQLKMTADSIRADLEESRALKRTADEQSAALREQLQSKGRPQHAGGGGAAAGRDDQVRAFFFGRGSPPMRHREPIPGSSRDSTGRGRGRGDADSSPDSPHHNG